MSDAGATSLGRSDLQL